MSERIEKARALRQEATPAEKLLWQHLRNGQLNVKFRRQVPAGVYTVDFACIEKKLVIEVDGESHAESKRDETRTKYLNSLGFEVIRFWNNEVLENIEGVVSAITKALKR
jgi:very-short-patch-repair endonuclease